jgi:hypothetical protein
MATGMLSADVPVWSKVALRNFGKTPAFSVRHAVTYKVLPLPLPVDLQVDEPSTDTDQVSFVLHPTQSRESTTNDTKPLSNADLQLLQSDRFALYIYGVVTYRDIHQIHHKATYCVYVRGSEIIAHRKRYVEGSTAPIVGRWTYANRYNDAD